ncbi:hypothetical protein [Brevibacillus daliensis]|uniref:hypothetical protein n=1 Tax=Brevibacillus daliensis TaxID=2892995 RepID=UPI001E5F064A|nr:hypothetical protein [Brevibacillus daliensis]
MTNQLSLAILVGLFATGGFFLFRYSFRATADTDGNGISKGLVAFVSLLLILLSSSITVFLLTGILWALGAFFPFFIDNSGFWWLVSFAALSFFLLALYEFLIEPLIIHGLKRFRLPVGGKYIPEIIVTTFVYDLINSTWITGVMLTSLTPLFAAMATVTIGYFLEKFAPLDKK